MLGDINEITHVKYYAELMIFAVEVLRRAQNNTLLFTALDLNQLKHNQVVPWRTKILPLSIIRTGF